ncbi:MAG: acetyl-CoA carboxylase carboxyltransferase subunit alpha [Planctomycetota bacterium]|nr:MAG: acetyl-CoA carboxylase carboxyltransferase subunit alpha [Planctomycetota bacterium]
MPEHQTILPFERPIFELEEKLRELEQQGDRSEATKQAIRNMQAEIQRLKREVFANLDPWDIVQVARHPERPQTLDYIELIFDDFMELHGDRAFRDDPAIITGLAKLDHHKVLLVGHQKGRNLKERTAYNFGMAHPEGYRKAIQKMQLAAKFQLPIICFIDTGGAYPGIGAEERGQAYCIAYNLREMSRLRTPILCVVLGEGGSGGALGIGVGDWIGMLEFSYYSVISPEGCAGILWKHAKYRDQAARALRFTARDLLEFEVIDEIIPEPLGGAHRDHRATATAVKSALLANLQKLSPLDRSQLVERRYERFRRMGVFEEHAQSKTPRTPAEVR